MEVDFSWLRHISNYYPYVFILIYVDLCRLLIVLF